MKRLILSLLALGSLATAGAQIRFGENGGQLTGSFDTNSIYYVDDSGLGSAGETPEDHWGSNSYLKLDYTWDRLSVGAQGDFFLPALQGYEIGNYGREYKFLLGAIYAQWQDRDYGIRIGSNYEQFGNGLIYRSFEDRQLGINNALMGAVGRVGYKGYFTLKGMYGRPRLYHEYANTWIGGADLSISLSRLLGGRKLNLSIEGSYVNRKESLNGDNLSADYFARKGLTDDQLHLYSGRLNLDVKDFYLRAEYAHKSKDLADNLAEEAKSGYAALAELGYNYKGFSISVQGRVLSHMGTRLSLHSLGTANMLNYLPALTRQYTYMLANLEPYQVNTEGEIGGQVDLYYSYRSKQSRHRYWNFHANFSTFYTLDKEQSLTGERELLWRDLNFDVERQWNKQWKTSLLYTYQEWSPSHGFEHRTYVANVFVADVTYKINRKHSLRWELQYLLSDEYQGDWVAGLLEYNFAPRWSIYFQNMYNLDKEPAVDKPLDEEGNPIQVYYYNGGFSFTHNRTRVQLSYGRNRAGYVCSGGVCRYTPAYTGVNLMLTTSF